MSTNSLGDSFATTVKRSDKVEKPGSSIIAPPHFGDVGKAANDTFSKVNIFYIIINYLRTFLSQVDICCIYLTKGTKIEVKTKTPNGVQFTVKGNQDAKVGRSLLLLN